MSSGWGQRFRRILAPLAMVCALGGGAWAADASPRSDGVQVDRVELLGITLFDRAEIEPALELTAGDYLDRNRVVRTADNLKALYNLRGYEQTHVHTEIARQKGEDSRLENVLRFVVTEGDPTRVGLIRLAPRNIRDEGFRKFWKKIEAELIAKVGLNPGDVFDQEKISNGKRALQDILASEEFVGAKVDDVRVDTAPPPAPATLPAAVAQGKTGRWVSLEFQVDLGDRVSFGYRGNTLLTQAKLDSIVDEQRVIGFGKDYVASIAARIAEQYRSMGYDRATVQSYSFENPREQERHVTYEIVEGPKVRIDSIDFEGNNLFTNEQLQEKLRDFSSPLMNQGFYYGKDVDKAAELLIEWMKSDGYLSAKLITVNRVYGVKMQIIRLVIYVYEGEQTVVQSVNLQGAFALTPDEIKNVLAVHENDPLDLFSFNEGLENLKSVYRAKGYLDVRIANEGTPSVVQYSQENRAADVALEVSEGPQYRVSRIEVEGLTATRQDIVLRELRFQEGDILEEQRMADSESRLRRLGIFAGVKIVPVDDVTKPGYKVVRVTVQEGTPGLVEGGVGFRNDLGVRIFADSAYTNLWQRNHTLSLSGAANKRTDGDFCKRTDFNNANLIVKDKCFIEYQARLGYIWPWFALGETTFYPRLTFSRTQYLNFDASSITFQASLERRLLQATNLSGIFTYSLESIHQFNAKSKVDNQQLLIGAVTPALKLDLRDNSLAPTQGLFALGSVEYAAPSFLSQTTPFPVSYVKAELRSDYYIPLAKEMTWFLSFRTGWERNNVDPYDSATGQKDPRKAIPLVKQFALGGIGSLRGFKEQELNAQTFSINGTLSYVNYRTQVDFPFAGPLRFGPFLDAAHLGIDRYSLGDLRYGTGVGFHYQSPVGPVNFDWGFKVNPRLGEDPYRFYFSIGII